MVGLLYRAAVKAARVTSHPYFLQLLDGVSDVLWVILIGN